jgi:hypothetical protein
MQEVLYEVASMLQCYITPLIYLTFGDRRQIRQSCVARAAAHTFESETCLAHSDRL